MTCLSITFIRTTSDRIIHGRPSVLPFHSLGLPPFLAKLALQIVTERAEGLNSSHLLTLDLYSECLLNNHNDVNEIQAVYSQILLEQCIGRNLLLIDFKIIDHEILDFGFNLLSVHILNLFDYFSLHTMMMCPP